MDSLPSARKSTSSLDTSRASTHGDPESIQLRSGQMTTTNGPMIAMGEETTSSDVRPFLLRLGLHAHTLISVDPAERNMGPPRDDVPLPTQPPFTAFVGNLAFDLLESDLAAFFEPLKVR